MNKVICARIRVGPISIGCFDQSDNAIASIRRSSIVGYTIDDGTSEIAVNVSLDNGDTYKVVLKRMLAANYFANRKILLETDLLGDSLGGES